MDCSVCSTISIASSLPRSSTLRAIRYPGSSRIMKLMPGGSPPSAEASSATASWPAASALIGILFPVLPSDGDSICPAEVSVCRAWIEVMISPRRHRVAYWLIGLLAYWLIGLLAYWLIGILLEAVICRRIFMLGSFFARFAKRYLLGRAVSAAVEDKAPRRRAPSARPLYVRESSWDSHSGMFVCVLNSVDGPYAPMPIADR